VSNGSSSDRPTINTRITKITSNKVYKNFLRDNMIDIKKQVEWRQKKVGKYITNNEMKVCKKRA